MREGGRMHLEPNDAKDTQENFQRATTIRISCHEMNETIETDLKTEKT